MTDVLPVYSVVVSREEELWVAVVDSIPAGATDVERFEDLPDAVSDMIATLVDAEPDEFWIDWHYRQGDHDFTDLIEQLREWEKLAERAARNRDITRRAVVEAMHSAGLSYREIADVIGVSHQRVGQLLSTPQIDVAFPQHRVDVLLRPKWIRQLRNTAIHGGAVDGQPSPFEAALIALLDSARRVPPDSRHDLLAATASLLDEASTDREFLMST